MGMNHRAVTPGMVRKGTLGVNDRTGRRGPQRAKKRKEHDRAKKNFEPLLFANVFPTDGRLHDVTSRDSDRE